jgi:hypothetical protein
LLGTLIAAAVTWYAIHRRREQHGHAPAPVAAPPSMDIPAPV